MAEPKKYAILNLTSHHFDRSKKRNEKNLGIGYEEKDGDFSKMFGGYKNSFNKNSLYALAGFTPIKIKDVDVGGFAGLATGYKKPIMPALGLLLQYDKGDYGINISIVPPIKIKGHKTEGFAGFQLKKLLK